MKPLLVSFRLCPFVRRSVITMRLKGMDHEVVFVDLADPPDWFLALSPLRKVPLLRVGEQVLFESGVINEYLDEVGPGSLHPVEPLEKARHRAWIEFGNQVTWHAFHLTAEKTETDFRRAVDNMWRDFDRLENALTAKPYFNGDELCLVDATFAPLFQQLEHIADLDGDIVNVHRHPRTTAWSRALCDHPVVQGALTEDFLRLYHDLIHRRRGFLSGFLDRPPASDSTPASRY